LNPRTGFELPKPIQVSAKLLKGRDRDPRALQLDHPIDAGRVSKAEVEDVAVRQATLAFDERKFEVRKDLTRDRLMISSTAFSSMRQLRLYASSIDGQQTLARDRHRGPTR
jgi:hypothetical protein